MYPPHLAPPNLRFRCVGCSLHRSFHRSQRPRFRRQRSFLFIFFFPRDLFQIGGPLSCCHWLRGGTHKSEPLFPYAPSPSPPFLRRLLVQGSVNPLSVPSSCGAQQPPWDPVDSFTIPFLFFFFTTSCLKTLFLFFPLQHPPFQQPELVSPSTFVPRLDLGSARCPFCAPATPPPFSFSPHQPSAFPILHDLCRFSHARKSSPLSVAPPFPPPSLVVAEGFH